MFFLCRPHASAPVFQPSTQVHDMSNLDRIVDYPVQIPNNFSYDFYIDVNVSMYHLLRIYSFLQILPKTDEPKLKMPVLLPVIYNFSATNPVNVSIRELNLLFDFVNAVYYEVAPPRASIPVEYSQAPVPGDVYSGVSQTGGTQVQGATGGTSTRTQIASSATKQQDIPTTQSQQRYLPPSGTSQASSASARRQGLIQSATAQSSVTGSASGMASSQMPSYAGQGAKPKVLPQPQTSTANPQQQSASTPRAITAQHPSTSPPSVQTSGQQSGVSRAIAAAHSGM